MRHSRQWDKRMAADVTRPAHGVVGKIGSNPQSEARGVLQCETGHGISSYESDKRKLGISSIPDCRQDHLSLPRFSSKPDEFDVRTRQSPIALDDVLVSRSRIFKYLQLRSFRYGYPLRTADCHLKFSTQIAREQSRLIVQQVST
jgi:hypothetical protein